MEAGSENDLQDDSVIVRNPTHCTAPIVNVKLTKSPFSLALGVMGEIVLQRIMRPVPTAATRSPWTLENMSDRVKCTVRIFYQKMLAREAEFVWNISCANIAGAMAAGSLDKCKRYLAMDYCSSDLAAILKQRYSRQLGPLEAPKAIKASIGILTALDYLHDKARILHGDVKSFNVLVRGDFDNVKLCGLGTTSKHLTPDGTLDNVTAIADSGVVGVGLWSAPEVFENNAANITTKVDIFSFGLVLYEMLTCMPPHTFPGIMDLVIAVPKEIITVRNFQKKKQDDQDDDDHVDDLESIKASRDGSTFMSKAKHGKYFARKRKFSSETGASDRIIIRSEGVIDLEDEEDPAIKDEPIAGGINAGKENEPDNSAVDEKVVPAAVVKTNDIGEPKETAPAPKTTATCEASAGPSDGSHEASDASDATVATTEMTLKPDYYSFLNAPPYTLSPMDIPPSGPPVASSEVVMVLDSSDEEHNPIRAINTGDIEYGEIDEDDVDCEDDITDMDEYNDDGTEEEEWDMDANFLNYGCLGTRPPIPAEISFDCQYDMLLEMFYVCTSKNHALRPSAAQLLQAYQESKPKKP